MIRLRICAQIICFAKKRIYVFNSNMKKLISAVLLLTTVWVIAACNRVPDNAENKLSTSYKSVLNDFEFMLESMQNGQFESYFSGESEYKFHFDADENADTNWWYWLSYLYTADLPQEKFLLALNDFDSDGTDEFVLLCPTESTVLMAIFSEKDGKAILIDAFGAGHYYARVCTDGTILTLSVGGISYEEIRANKMRD